MALLVGIYGIGMFVAVWYLLIRIAWKNRGKR